jgi:hypothetical protein
MCRLLLSSVIDVTEKRYVMSGATWTHLGISLMVVAVMSVVVCIVIFKILGKKIRKNLKKNYVKLIGFPLSRQGK